ncbi:MAG: FAD-dependent oxidoreductase [Planctomycetia bacterium]|nr:FAD-dependent oxidoreductase [Planctomycetia bacterium]
MRKRVAIIGGGLAGLAAAVEIRNLEREKGMEPPEIHLFEATSTLGGRAGGYFWSEANLWLDYSMHVFMHACASLRQFLENTHLDAFWQTQPQINFLMRKKGVFPFRGSNSLPVPLHLAPGLWRLKFLSPWERLTAAKIMRAIHAYPMPEGWTFGEWLNWRRCSYNVRNLFFEPIVLSAFCAQLENVSARMVKKLFDAVFFTTTDAWRVALPTRPLNEIFNDRLEPFLEKIDIRVHRNHRIENVRQGCARDNATQEGNVVVSVKNQRTQQSESSCFDAVFCAVPWHEAPRLIPFLRKETWFKEQILVPNGIGSVHCWTDETWFEHNHAAVLGETIQWIFRIPHADNQWGRCYQVLLSDPQGCGVTSRDTLQKLVWGEVQALFPNAKINRMKSFMHAQAVFVPTPATEKVRPRNATSVPRLYLAGDWTLTPYPSTMEGAVLSGKNAVLEWFRDLESNPAL